MEPGGLSPVQPATAEIQEMVSGVKKAAEEKTGQNYDMFEAIAYRSQVVAGTNYFVKVQVGCDSYIELRIFVSLDGKCELNGVKQGLTKDSPIEYFQ